MRTAEGKVAVLIPAARVQRITDQLERMPSPTTSPAISGWTAGMVLDQFRKAAAERSGEDHRARRGVRLRHDERMLLNALLDRPRSCAANLIAHAEGH